MIRPFCPIIVVFWALLTFSYLAIVPIIFRHPRLNEALKPEAGRVRDGRVRLKDGEVTISINRLSNTEYREGASLRAGTPEGNSRP